MRTLVRSLIADDPRAWREFNTRYSRLVLSTISRGHRALQRCGVAEDMARNLRRFCVQLLAEHE